MPTLHLIDADSSQACPAVMSAIRRSMADGCGDDRLLLLFGGRPLVDLAHRAGIEQVHPIQTPIGGVYLAHRKIKGWLETQPGFDRVHCWSIDALDASARAFVDTPIHLSVVHTPRATKLNHLKRIVLNRRDDRVRVHTSTATLRGQLNSVGVTSDVDPSLTDISEGSPAHALSKTDLRGQWHAGGSNHRVVALLSDHPSLADAVDAASIVCLAGASLVDGHGQPQTITLLMHPDQRHRRRAQYFLADQSDGHRVIQDARAVEPWLVLPGCDAVLAIGPDAGGLSLGWALASGIPVVAAPTPAPGFIPELTPGVTPTTTGQIKQEAGGFTQLRIARSDAHKDLAHVLHGVLGGFMDKQSACGETARK
jgi:hypothetical protein